VLVVDRGTGGLELHLHGSPAVLVALRSRFHVGSTAAAAAEPAEVLLRTALSPEQLDLALEQRAFRFADLQRELASLAPTQRRRAVAGVQHRSFAAMAMSEPQRLVLVGAQNAGKSTLFNHLLFRERVLTGPLPGLTRDPVTETTTLCGYPYEIVDTAGEGPPATAIDAAAIVAGRDVRKAANVLLVVDQSRGPTALDVTLGAQAWLVIATKDDLEGPRWPDDFPCHLRISCTTSDGPSVRRRVGELLMRARNLPPAGRVGGVAALTRVQYDTLAPWMTHG